MVDQSELDLLKSVITEYSPEVLDLFDARRDTGDEDGSKTGRQHENHILGIILGYDFKDEDDGQITTTDIENEYELFFKKIARSTVSTYLNQLDKEGVLTKRRDGRTVFYLLKQKPPFHINPFWIVRNFCIITPYFYRAIVLARLYKVSQPNESTTMVEARKFLIGLAILICLRNRIINCLMCQFAIKEEYRETRDEFDVIIKNRSDVMPEEILKYLNLLGEIPIFGGYENLSDKKFPDVLSKLNELAERYSQDIDFQISVSRRRKDLRIKFLEQKQKREQEEAIKEAMEREKEDKLNKIKESVQKKAKKSKGKIQDDE